MEPRVEDAGVSAAIVALSRRIEGLIGRDGGSADTVRAVAECLADLVRLPEYREPVMAMLSDPFSDDQARAFVARIKRDIRVLEPLGYNQLGVYLRKIADDYYDLSCLYLVLGPNWIDLGQPRLEAEATGPLH